MAQNARARAKLTVKINTSKVNKVKKELADALEKTGDDLMDDLIESQMMPYETGSLQRSLKVDKSTSSQGRVAVVTDSPHAKHVYYDPDVSISRKINKNARAHWYGSYIRGNKKEFFMNTFEKNFKRGRGKWVRKK